MATLASLYNVHNCLYVSKCWNRCCPGVVEIYNLFSTFIEFWCHICKGECLVNACDLLYWLVCYVFSLKGNKQVAAAIAFSLALFSHALNHAMMRLQTALYEVENPPRKFTNLTPGILSGVVTLYSVVENSFGWNI